MINKLISALALSLLFAASANAATLSIGGPDSATVGDSFDLVITGDFGVDGLIAGGISFFWDPTKVQLNSITRAFGDVFFSCPGSNNCPPNTADTAAIVWGEFLNDLIDPNAGPTEMATLSFTAIATAAEDLAIFTMDTNDGLTGGWFGAGFTPIATPTFEGHQVQINAVPLPAAVWFMVGGLGTLLGFRRK